MPVVAVESYTAQVFLLSLIFVVWLVVQVRSNCWRLQHMNTLESLASGMQILVLGIFATLNTEIAPATAGVCIIVLMLLGQMVLFVAMISAVIQRFGSSSQYDVFLSHHKAAASIFARHIKMLLPHRRFYGQIKCIARFP